LRTVNYKTSQLMLYGEIIGVCSETKHVNTLCGQNVGFFDVEPGGTYSDHRAVNDRDCRLTLTVQNRYYRTISIHEF
jgi:hypothetical protein